MALIDRVKNILLSPKTEWPKIAGETATVQSHQRAWRRTFPVVLEEVEAEIAGLHADGRLPAHGRDWSHSPVLKPYGWWGVGGHVAHVSAHAVLTAGYLAAEVNVTRSDCNRGHPSCAVWPFICEAPLSFFFSILIALL